MKDEIEEVKPYYFNKDGVLCINLCCDGANSDPIRSARLANGTDEDKAELKRLSEIPMVKLKRGK
jgi:hypothetical protein